jgi:16S rRNA U516 pseudouridylate synthase RsuA-like enzyme
MNDDILNMSLRKFLKKVGVTSQREIEKVVRDGKARGDVLKVRMTLVSEDGALDHVVEGEIPIG